jgi:hypothetical protein
VGHTANVRSVAIAAIALVGVSPVAASAATKPPVVKATGKISALSKSSITIDGTRDVTCRVRSVVPGALGFRIGTSAKMICLRGVLIAITGPATAKSGTDGKSSSTSTSTSTSTATATASGGGTAVAATISGDTFRLAGAGTITAVGGGKLSFSGEVTCSVGAGSPDVSAFKVGDRVNYKCTATVPPSLADDTKAAFEQLKKTATLTSIERAT